MCMRVYMRACHSNMNCFQVSDEAIAEYERTHCDREHKMCAFFQLKAVLAPCIEALILLDRLHFLLEQVSRASSTKMHLFHIPIGRSYAISSHDVFSFGSSYVVPFLCS